ncbi:MAG: hypothetical protein EB117_13555 [Betaproteobacteria bacterium]|nr:hypothetical protein [Betaproteobacteria bacterium]
MLRVFSLSEARVTHHLITGDCLSILPALEKHSIDLVLADPPYGIGVDYGAGPKADRRPDYDIWCERWINWCYRALKPTGSMWIISGQEHGADIDIAMQRCGLTMRNRITWRACRRNCPRSLSSGSSACRAAAATSCSTRSPVPEQRSRWRPVWGAMRSGAS